MASSGSLDSKHKTKLMFSYLRSSSPTDISSKCSVTLALLKATRILGEIEC